MTVEPELPDELLNEAREYTDTAVTVSYTHLPKNTMLLIAISPICVPPFLSVRYDTCIVGVEA